MQIRMPHEPEVMCRQRGWSAGDSQREEAFSVFTQKSFVSIELPSSIQNKIIHIPKYAPSKENETANGTPIGIASDELCSGMTK